MASTTLAAVDFLVVDDADWRRVFDFCFWMMLCVFFLTSSFSFCACGWRIWECGLLVFLWGPCLACGVLEACHIMQHQQLNDAFCKFVISNKFCFRFACLMCLFQRRLFSIQCWSCDCTTTGRHDVVHALLISDKVFSGWAAWNLSVSALYFVCKFRCSRIPQPTTTKWRIHELANSDKFCGRFVCLIFGFQIRVRIIQF